jgi:hypothetical protein
MTRSLSLPAAVAVALAAALALCAAPAQAQKKPSASAQKKLYRWVDAEGKVHVGDTLPADALDRARQEINSRTGDVQATVDRALTPEEKAAQAAEAQRTQAADAIAAQQKRNEDAMLSSYLTEDDLKRAYQERISLLKQTLESTDVSLMSLRASLAQQLANAAEAELQGRKVPDKQLATVRDLHGELIKQRTYQTNRHNELLSLDAEYERMLERYRSRRAQEAAEKLGTAAPAPAAAPPQP